VSSLSGADAPTTTTTPIAIPEIPDRLWSWNREPVGSVLDCGGVTWTAPAKSDFWRKTEGVPSAHDGSSLLTLVEGDFTFELQARGSFTGLFDQVGLMVVSSEERWLKAGIEIDGEIWLSAVHTREESDWSRERWGSAGVGLRAVRSDDTIEVSVEDPAGWRTFRILYLPGPVGLGPYSCSPKGDGFEASVTGLKLT
jgi:uncharacterized protein